MKTMTNKILEAIKKNWFIALIISILFYKKITKRKEEVYPFWHYPILGVLSFVFWTLVLLWVTGLLDKLLGLL